MVLDILNLGVGWGTNHADTDSSCQVIDVLKLLYMPYAYKFAVKKIAVFLHDSSNWNPKIHR